MYMQKYFIFLYSTDTRYRYQNMTGAPQVPAGTKFRYTDTAVQMCLFVPNFGLFGLLGTKKCQ
eukprot:SAG11_NODE_9931_length_869_cov_0.784416_2_plen_62_part_01